MPIAVCSEQLTGLGIAQCASARRVDKSIAHGDVPLPLAFGHENFHALANHFPRAVTKQLLCPTIHQCDATIGICYHQRIRRRFQQCLKLLLLLRLLSPRQLQFRDIEIHTGHEHGLARIVTAHLAAGVHVYGTAIGA